MPKRNPLISLVPIFFILGIIILLISSCVPTDSLPAPDSDSQQNFTSGSQIPVDDNVYYIKGEVITDVNSLVRQTDSAHGNSAGYITGGYGFVSGSYYGPEFGGKGFVRILVMNSDSWLAPEGKIVILKSTDTKGTALLPGDIVEFKCRHQYESIAAVRNYETFDEEKLETWEIDYCRMISPIISQLILPTEVSN
jgi:hypothetical protein